MPKHGKRLNQRIRPAGLTHRPDVARPNWQAPHDPHRRCPCTCANPAHVWQWEQELQGYVRLDLTRD